MPDSITTAFVQEYKGAVELLLQQSGSRLADKVTRDSYVGKAASVVEQFGPVAAVKKTTRHGDTPLLDVPQAKRWVFPVDYEWASLIDNEDKLRMIVDPTSAYAVNGANAMSRAQDDEIIDAFFGTAKVGENGSTDEAFNTTDYQVAVATGGAASSLNVAKLQLALRKMMGAFKGEVTEAIYCAISSYEHDALLKEVQITSRDFNGGQPVLVNGKISSFMGANFTVTERLDISGGNRLIPYWVSTGMHMGTWNGLMTQVGPRADKSYANQVYLCQTIGATRLQDGKVIQILCDDQI